MIRKKASSVIALSAAAALGLSACGGGTTAGDDTTSSDGAAAQGEKGGTLHYLTRRPTEHLDPQRSYVGRDLSNMSRLVYRKLVQFPVNKDDAIEAQTPIPDVATDTGTAEDGGKTWKFTLKEGVKWEDGKDTTCEDFKYGISRVFATDVITGGPSYGRLRLDIPQDKNGESVYKGPYTKKGQAEFDKAVTCDGNVITYHFSEPWADFPLAVASLNDFAPYREDLDKGDKNNLKVISNGPYKLEGAWKTGSGGTFVRNDQYDPETDEGTRAALPDKIVFTEGLENEIITDRLIAESGEDKNAITDRAIPPSAYSQIEGPIAERATNLESPYTFYLVPNHDQMKNKKVRQALAAATDRAAYAAAMGGEKASKPSLSIVAPDVPGYTENPAFKDIPAEGDTAAAKKLLEESGETMPYPIQYTYQGGTPTSDKAAAALKSGWDKAGFKTTLNPLTDTYYDVIQKPGQKWDVAQGGWGADWPSAATVLPALFSSKILTSSSNAENYGRFVNDEVDQLFADGAAEADIEAANKIYAEADAKLGEEVAYIPLDIQMFYFLRGSGVTGYTQTAATSNFPDLGTIGVAK
ncbi:ABC transporter substrate-binding protein [Janibacter sp. G1551]|uniref:ABC transporter substrate-binding protein n=1 Tax=Janibacter sp. G1551 TaxID=3420440 RepID=UPI003CFEABA5